MEPILLLHGAVGAAPQLSGIASILGRKFDVHSLNFFGHGGEAEAGNFSIEAFGQQVLQYIESAKLPGVHIFGYSMGGYVAMWLAKNHPGKVRSVITLGTKFHWDKQVAAKEINFLDPQKIEDKIPKYALELAKRHQPGDWKMVLQKTSAMLVEMGNKNPLTLQDYKDILQPVLVLIGDRDKMVTMSETIEVYQSLPHGQLGILPATPHPVEQVDPNILEMLVTSFIEKAVKTPAGS